MSKLEFAIKACSDTGATSSREKAYWERQYNMYNSGVRNAEMHCYTLVKLSQVERR